MKLAILAFALSFSTLTFACPNFSGVYSYDNDLDKLETTIVQHGCESMDMINSDQTVSFIIDGAYHQTIDQDIVIEGQTIGHMNVSHRAIFNNSDLILDTKAHIEAMGQIQDEEIKSVNSLLPNGNVKTVTTYKDGHQETTIAKRIR